MERKKILGLDKFEPDKTLQEDYKLSRIEELILKPHREDISRLTKQEVLEYLEIDVEGADEVDTKLIAICKATQNVLKDNLEEILKRIENREREEEQNEK